MKNVVLRIMKRLLREAAVSSQRELHIYDFDDTLVKTDSRVQLTSSEGNKRLLTPHEYAVYVPQAGDTFEYDDFEKVINPKPIETMMTKMRQSIMEHGLDNVFVLTARGNSAPVREYLASVGFKDIMVHAVGTSAPSAKAQVIYQEILNKNPLRVMFYDDSPKYIAAVENLRKDFPNVQIVTIQV